MKYQPDYPGRFSGELHARGWLQDFFGWHNDDHHHSGLALFTPADVFHGRVEAVRVVRQLALDEAHAAHPERFPNGPPRVPLPPIEVCINPFTAEALSVVAAASIDVLAIASNDDHANLDRKKRSPARRAGSLTLST